MEADPNPTSKAARLKYREPAWYYLVIFKRDSIFHVCRSNEVQYRRRRLETKIVTFGRYEGLWYECRILARNTDRKYLQQELRAAVKRSQNIVLSERARKNADNFALVQFAVGKDFQVVPYQDVVTNLDGRTSIKCHDGAFRMVLVIETGGRFLFFELWRCLLHDLLLFCRLRRVNS